MKYISKKSWTVLKKRESVKKYKRVVVFQPDNCPWESNMIDPEWEEYLPHIRRHLKERWCGLKLQAQRGIWRSSTLAALTFEGTGGLLIDLEVVSNKWRARALWDGDELLQVTESKDSWREALDGALEVLPGYIEKVANNALDIYEGFVISQKKSPPR